MESALKKGTFPENLNNNCKLYIFLHTLWIYLLDILANLAMFLANCNPIILVLASVLAINTRCKQGPILPPFNTFYKI